ncbi:MAG: hypothetical protein K8J31_26470 [Anaerolineae bacterium]|nr:hypothetical protein [Anaerolineae bacterium]
MPKLFKSVLPTLLLLSLLFAIPVALAQEEAAAETTAIPPGISVGVFLLGVLAVLAVGITMIARDNFKSDGDEQPR